MRQLEFLKKIISVLNKYNIDYMITGSIASSLQGEPRSTHDVDIVIQVSNIDNISLITDDFKIPDYYLDIESISDALRHESMFNLIDTNFGEKADFWILTKSEFDKSRFKRKISETIDDLRFFVSSPEDTIIAKLEWCKNSGGSKKHFTDAQRIFELQKDSLDMHYIKKWIEEMQIADLWEEILKNN